MFWNWPSSLTSTFLSVIDQDLSVTPQQFWEKKGSGEAEGVKVLHEGEGSETAGEQSEQALYKN